MVGPCWKYRFYDVLRTFYQNNGSPVKNRFFFPINPHFVCMCALALPSLWGHILICLVCRTQPLTMKWSENQRSRLTSNRPMPADINKRAGSGLRVCAEIFEWENAVVYCYSTLFVLKLGDDNLDIQCAICSKFVNFYAPGMVKTLGPQHFPVLIPYSHIHTVLNPYFRILERKTQDAAHEPECSHVWQWYEFRNA